MYLDVWGFSSWWLNQPIWKICSSNWILSPKVGLQIKNIWNETTTEFYSDMAPSAIINHLNVGHYLETLGNSAVPGGRSAVTPITKAVFFFSAGHEWDTTHQIGLYKEQTKTDSPQDPSDERYIYLHEWLICMVNVGKYTSPMDPMGTMFLRHDFVSLVNVVLSWIIWRWRSLRLQQRAGV